MSRKKQAKAGALASKRRRRRLIGAGAAIAVAVAAGVWAIATTGQREVRAERIEYAPVTGPLTFPASVADAEPELRSLYEFAARRPDVLHYLPCFCGCGAVHRSNYDCFIDEVRADGTVFIDDMSFT